MGQYEVEVKVKGLLVSRKVVSQEKSCKNMENK